MDKKLKQLELQMAYATKLLEQLEAGYKQCHRDIKELKRRNKRLRNQIKFGK